MLIFFNGPGIVYAVPRLFGRFFVHTVFLDMVGLFKEYFYNGAHCVSCENNKFPCKVGWYII